MLLPPSPDVLRDRSDPDLASEDRDAMSESCRDTGLYELYVNEYGLARWGPCLRNILYTIRDHTGSDHWDIQGGGEFHASENRREKRGEHTQNKRNEYTTQQTKARRNTSYISYVFK